MRKNKILSTILAMAMAISIMPSAISATNSNVIYSEDYNNGYNFPHTEGKAAPTVENGMVLTPPSGSEGGFWFDSLNAAVADAPLGKIRVRFDFKSHDPGPAATKMTLKTNAGNVTFLSYGLYGSIRDDALSNATGNPGFTPNVWHDNDIVFDFANNKIIYNVTNKETGAKVFDNFELSKDLSGITHVKGFDLYGWAGITYFDNLLIEYVVENETPEIPDEPEFKKDIFSENYDGKTLTDIASTIDAAPSIVDGAVKLAQSGGSGFKITSFEAEAKGQIRVKFDLNAPNVDTAATTTKVLTNSGGIPLVSYGVWGGIRPTQLEEPIGGAGFVGDVWYVNDIVLDFDNNKIIYTITALESGEVKLSEYAVDYDLSSVSKINGFEMYGWAGPAKHDNLVIEYVVEEETPEIPDEPEIIKDIFEENFDGKTLTDIAGTIDTAPSIVDGAVTLAQSGGSGFKFTSFEAEAKGQVRVKFEMSAPNVGTAATTTKVLTNSGGIPLVSYGVWGGIRPTQMEEPIGGAGFDGDVWYINDIILDFDNNKIIYTITALESGDAKLSEYAVDYDLSAVTKINGFEMYGWAGPAKLDNLVVEYVVEEETPDVPDEPEIKKDIFAENYDGKTLTDIASTIDNAPSIVDGVVTLAQSGGSGFKFTSFEAEAKGQVRVKFEMSAPNVGTAATTTKVLTNSGGIPLVSYGVWGGIRPTQLEDAIGGASFVGDVWHVNDIILDFDNNKIIYTITELESGDAKLSEYAVDYDLSAITKINGFEMYGWAGPAKLDNLVIEYVVEEETPEIPDEPEIIKDIFSENYDGKTLTDIAGTIDNAPSIVDGVVKLAQSGGSGFKFTSFEAEAKGQVRVKFEMSAPNVDTAATTTKVLTNSGGIPLVSYGVWGGIRPTQMEEPIGGAGFDGDVWYINDIILDFDNNKIIYTITALESGDAKLSAYAVDYDLSAVTKINGFEMYGWAGPAMLDNLVIEYVVEETPEIPEDPDFTAGIYAEEYDGKTLTDFASTIDTAPSIVDGVVKLAQTGGSGFKFTSLNADAKGQVRVKFDTNAPNVDTSATTAKLHVDSGSVPLISYGTWGGIRPTWDSEPLGGAGYIADTWYENDIVLDFDTNKIIYTITEKETGVAAISEYAIDYDLSAVKKIKGFEFYGWAGPAMLDNLVIEYTSKDPYVSADNIKIFADDKEQKHSSVNPGADKIEIDFVGVLKASSLENAVVITNETDSTVVEYTGAVVGSRYIMTLKEGLAPSKQFKITISADVENIFGVKLGGEHAFSFATNAGYVNITSISLTQNGNAVENLAGLTAGQEAKVKIDFEKTSNDERKIKLIYAYYNGTQLVKNVVKTVTIGATDRAGSKEDIQVIEDLGGITSVSVMVWENFQTIKPLCEDIKLN